MATRFLIIIPKNERARLTPAAEQRISTTAGLPIRCKTGHATLFIDEPEDLTGLTNPPGAVIGTVFSRENRPRQLSGLAGFPSGMTATALVTHAWGAYVAVLLTDQGVEVLRDPSGAMPCYFVEQADAIIVTSDVETLANAALLAPAIDWPFLRRQFWAYDFRTADTGLEGVKELLAGFCLQIGPDRISIAQVWSPWSSAQSPNIRPIHELADELRATLLSTIAIWSHRYPRTLLGVSGGLDSSIIAAAVRQARGDLRCLTLATDEGEGDERSYARLLCNALGMPLIERRHELRDVDVTRSTSAHLPRPMQYAFAQSDHRTRWELAHELGCEAFFSGIGGDNVFASSRSASSLVDRWRTEGITPGLAETLNNICTLTGCSAWEALRMAAGRVTRPAVGYRVQADLRYLPEDTEVDCDSLSHPWLVAPTDALPGKTAHIAGLARIQSTIDGYPRYGLGPQVLPLLSQPVVEACLRIPSWVWVTDGRDRAVARAAFASLLPAEIAYRRSKGGPQSFAFEVIESHKRLLMSHLCDGLLARHGLIDPVKLETVLNSPAPIPAADHFRIAGFAEAEAWARYWTAKQATEAIAPLFTQ